MKRLMVLLFVSVIFSFTINTVYGQTSIQVDPAKSRVSGNEYYCPSHPVVRANWAAKCPICGQTLTMQTKQQTEQAIAKRQRAEEMRRKMMLNTSISVFDPEAILGARKPLGLTQVQIEKLQAISMAARDSAKQILTSKQKNELSSLDRLSSYPSTMAQMHSRMLQQVSPSDSKISNMMPGQRKTSDPPAQVSRQRDSGSAMHGDPPKADPPAVRNNAGNQMRDSYRDMYRDRYRDQMRDRNRDYDRDRNLFGYNYTYPYNYGYTYIYPYSYIWPYSNPYYEPYNYYYQLPNNYDNYPY